MDDGSGEEKHRNAFTAFFNPPTSTPLIRHTVTEAQEVATTTPRPKPKITPRQRTPSPRKAAPRPPPQTPRPPVLTTASPPRQQDQEDYAGDQEDYDYYYDQLVPEHERFFQLPKNSEADSAQTSGEDGGDEENKAGFAVFTHFSEAPLGQKQNGGGNSKPRGGGGGGGSANRNNRKEKKVPSRRPKVQTSSGFGGGKANTIAQPRPKPAGDSGPSSGPFGYTEKGTFFIDSHFSGFPKSIDLVYQGFVWAFTMNYDSQPSVLHGGVHTILLDKVKKETINLAGDHIVRVTGRASPYNINRLTLYTKQGRKFGPWGDRHSDESVDFDVSAPAGHGLAFFSGTIDFGVPLRSVSFHWRPIQ